MQEYMDFVLNDYTQKSLLFKMTWKNLISYVIQHWHWPTVHENLPWLTSEDKMYLINIIAKHSDILHEDMSKSEPPSDAKGCDYFQGSHLLSQLALLTTKKPQSLVSSDTNLEGATNHYTNTLKSEKEFARWCQSHSAPSDQKYFPKNADYLHTLRTNVILERLCGPFYQLILQGHIEKYRTRLWLSTQPQLRTFDEGLENLKKDFVQSWSDPFSRIPWVQNPEIDIIQPIENLKYSDYNIANNKAFQKILKLKDINYSAYLAHYAYIREYYLLSQISSFLYSDIQCQCADSQCSYICSETKEKYTQFIIKYKHKLRSRKSFTHWIKDYYSSHLSTHELLVSDVYDLHITCSNSAGFAPRGILSHNGEFLMTQWLESLKKGFILYGLPLLRQEITNESLHGHWAKGSFHVWIHDSVHSRSFLSFINVWNTIILDHSITPVTHIIDKMWERITQVHYDADKVSKIVLSTFYFHHELAPGASLPIIFNRQFDKTYTHSIQDPVYKSLIRSFFDHKMDIEEIKDTLHAWLQDYPVSIILEIMDKTKYKPHIDDDTTLFAEEWGLEKINFPTVTKTLEEIMEAYYAPDAHNFAFRHFHTKNNIQQPFTPWCKAFKSQLELQESGVVSCKLWDMPFPLIFDQSCTCILLFPKKSALLPPLSHEMPYKKRFYKVQKIIGEILPKFWHTPMH